MTQANSDPLDRAIVVSQLLYAALKLPCFMFDIARNQIIEIPDNLVNDCLCTRLSKAAGTEVDLGHAFKRFRDACTLDTNLTHCCPYGLSAITVPVKSGDKLVAVVSFGPILTCDPDDILNKHVLARPDISSADKEALASYLYAMKPYDADFLNAFSQIITLALNKDTELSLASRAPISEFGIQEEKSRCYSCPDTVQVALRYIAENYTNDISLIDVAEHVYVHPTHLSKLFNKYVSFSFRDYLNHLRISRARLLLLDSQKTIATICFEVGFSDQSYFNKVFKAIEGITPGQFRDQSLPKQHKATCIVQKNDSSDKYRNLRSVALM